jgi:hypothetical protein
MGSPQLGQVNSLIRSFFHPEREFGQRRSKERIEREECDLPVIEASRHVKTTIGIPQDQDVTEGCHGQCGHAAQPQGLPYLGGPRNALPATSPHRKLGASTALGDLAHIGARSLVELRPPR